MTPNIRPFIILSDINIGALESSVNKHLKMGYIIYSFPQAVFDPVDSNIVFFVSMGFGFSEHEIEKYTKYMESN